MSKSYMGADAPNGKKSLADFAFAGDSFLAGDDDPQEWLIDGLFPHPSAGMLWGWRGLGKTWGSISLAVAIARKGCWLDNGAMKAGKARKIVYLDFEMSRNALRRRFRLATGGKMPVNLVVVPVEEYTKQTGNNKPNLAKEEDRAQVIELLAVLEKRLGGDIEMVVIDNWVSAVRGLDENDNAALGEVVNWMTRVRAKGISILFVHHSSKSGVQRGASAREDLLDYVVALEKPRDWKPYGPAHFIVNLEKTRESPDPMVWCEPIEAKLVAGRWQTCAAGEVEAENIEKWTRETETKLLKGLAKGEAPSNTLPKVNGKIRSAVLVSMSERGWVTRKDMTKERSPWVLTENGQAELTKRDRTAGAVAEIPMKTAA